MYSSISFRVKITTVLALCLLFAAPQVFAQQKGADIADKACTEFAGKCQYQKVCDPKKKPAVIEDIGIVGKPCSDPRGVQGTCVSYGVCKATTATGSGGQSMNVGGLGELLGAVSKILGALGGGQPPAGGGGGGIGGGTGGCSSYTPVSSPTANPCEYYVPSIGSSINIDAGTGGAGGTGSTGGSNPISDLLNSLTGGSGGSSNTNTNTNTNTGSNTPGSGGTSGANSGTGANTGTSTGGVSSTTAGQAAGIGPGGVKGDIRVLPDGTTVVVTNQNTPGNSVIAGFLGMQTSGGAQAQGIAANLCRTRPWANNFLSFIVPPVFFDSLCTLRGFQVGDAPVAPGGPAQVGVQTTIIRNPAPANPIVVPVQPNIPAIPASPQMQVDIWATPAAVPLGTRTTIFWSSKNAESCVETSPDGSFSHSTLSGGGATVPLSGATTFTISCTAADGTHATDFVTVRLTI